MVFAREVTSLVKKLDQANDKNKGMANFFVFLSDDEGLEKQLKDLAEKEGLKNTVLTIDSPRGPSGYDIAKDADVTVILYKQKNVKINHAYKKGEFQQKDVEKIVSNDLPKIVTSDKDTD
jgi:hypothetical protein